MNIKKLFLTLIFLSLFGTGLTHANVEITVAVENNDFPPYTYGRKSKY